jgi:hypothetical protein
MEKRDENQIPTARVVKPLKPKTFRFTNMLCLKRQREKHGHLINNHRVDDRK